MTDSPQLQNLTLNPAETVFSIPPHRRRPIRSRTYDALVGILSVCRTNFTQLQTQGKVDRGDEELTPVSEKIGSIAENVVSSKVALPPDCNESDDTSVQETSIGVNKEDVSFGDGGFDIQQTTIPMLDKPNTATEVEQEVDPANKMSVEDFLGVENQKDDCAIQIAKEQEKLNGVLDIQMDDFGTFGDLQVDKDFGIDELSEVLDSCFGMDMVIESSKAVEEKENILSQADHELQQKEMELEKLIYNSDLMDSSRLNDDEEIEEGEISGEADVAAGSLDALSEDALSLGERTVEKVLASDNSLSKENLICNNEDRVNSDCNSMKLEVRVATRQMQECYSELLNDSHMETQRSGPKECCSENLTSSARALPENAAENRTSATTEQDGDGCKRKRKKGPLTKERRAKKKKKERIKRAEKNRELGVKRLKLQPFLKPKTVTYCRHYLQGRCHEGEKCKFSHDTVPLTKSKPCGHFARHSCMKGDDCPFDHQLSKYPCKNYTSNGFCPRGSACLFSHESQMPPTQNLPTTPNVSKPEMKFPSPMNNSNSSNHKDANNTSHQKIDAIFCSTGKSTGKSAELLTKPAPITARPTPKGVSFLLNGGTSLVDTTKHKQDESSLKTSDRVDTSHATILKVPGSINKNEMSEKVTPRKPQGINFLSFAQPSSNDSGSKMLNMLSKSDNGGGKSVIDGNKSKLTCSLTERPNNHFNNGEAFLSSVKERESTPSKLQETMKMPLNLTGSLRTSLLSNSPSSVRKAVQSTLAFAAKFESDIKVGSSSLHKQGS